MRRVPEKTHKVRTFISHLLTYFLAPSAQVVQNGCTSRQREQWRTFPFPRTCLRNPRPGSPSLPSWCKQDRKRPPRQAGSRESAGASWQDGLELARLSTDKEGGKPQAENQPGQGQDESKVKRHPPKQARSCQALTTTTPATIPEHSKRKIDCICLCNISCTSFAARTNWMFYGKPTENPEEML